MSTWTATKDKTSKTDPYRMTDFLPLQWAQSYCGKPILVNSEKAEAGAYRTVPSAFILPNSYFSLSPRGRFELPTLRLTAECSAIELTGNRLIFRGLLNP